MRRLKNVITYANVMATAAIALSVGGSAYAAITITGANVKDSTLTGADVKNYSLSPVDLSAAAKQSFKGDTGPKGDTGSRGLTGLTGPKGDTGAPGAPAEVVTSFANRDTGFVRRRVVEPPNPNTRDWFDYNCNMDETTNTACPSLNGNQTNSAVGVVELIPSGTVVVALSGINVDPDEVLHNFSSRSNLVVPWSSNLTGMTSLTMMHRGTIHERFECALEYANVADPETFARLGSPQVVSAFGERELVSLSLVGSKNVPAGTYNVQVKCYDMDDSNSPTPSWRFVRGNLTAMAARNG